jgi:hypothetical protein
MPMTTRPCSQCQKPIRRYPSLFGPQPVCSKKCRTARLRSQTGERNPCWRGGRYTAPNGYVYVRVPPGHHLARANGYAPEHRLVMELALGRRLLPKEVVHHLNHTRADNRPENLQLYESHSEHWEREHLHEVKPKGPPCWCGRSCLARQLCPRHYAQMRRRMHTDRSAHPR